MSQKDPREQRDPKRSETDPELDIDEGQTYSKSEKTPSRANEATQRSAKMKTSSI